MKKLYFVSAITLIFSILVQLTAPVAKEAATKKAPKLNRTKVAIATDGNLVLKMKNVKDDVDVRIGYKNCINIVKLIYDQHLYYFTLKCLFHEFYHLLQQRVLQGDLVGVLPITDEEVDI